MRLFADGEGSTFETDLDTLRRDHGDDDVERLLAALNAVKSQRLVWTVERDVALLAEVWRTGAVTGIALPTPKSARVATPRAGDGSETARAHERRLQELRAQLPEELVDIFLEGRSGAFALREIVPANWSLPPLPLSYDAATVLSAEGAVAPLPVGTADSSGPSSAVGGCSTSFQSGNTTPGGVVGWGSGTQPITIVSAMPASLCWCASWKSGRDCMSMNDRRVGYLTTATRSQVGAPSNCCSTSPKNTGAAPISPRISTGA